MFTYFCQGSVIKTNNNQRYATNAETGFLLRELARRAGAPVQVRYLGTYGTVSTGTYCR